MYEDISDFTDEERRAVYYYELLRERADMGILYGEDRITYDWAKQVLARRQVQATPPVAMVGYGYFTLVPGQERFQLKLMAGVLGAILVLIAIANLFLS